MVTHAIVGMVIKLPVEREGGKDGGDTTNITRKKGRQWEATLGTHSGPGLVEKNPKHGAIF
jgi:hypothetical protein